MFPDPTSFDVGNPLLDKLTYSRNIFSQDIRDWLDEQWAIEQISLDEAGPISFHKTASAWYTCPDCGYRWLEDTDLGDPFVDIVQCISCSNQGVRSSGYVSKS